MHENPLGIGFRVRNIYTRDVPGGYSCRVGSRAPAARACTCCSHVAPKTFSSFSLSVFIMADGLVFLILFFPWPAREPSRALPHGNPRRRGEEEHRREKNIRRRRKRNNAHKNHPRAAPNKLYADGDGIKKTTILFPRRA